jgi:hypothetical protein
LEIYARKDISKPVAVGGVCEDVDWTRPIKEGLTTGYCARRNGPSGSVYGDAC